MADGGQGQSQGKFFLGWTDGRTADKKRRENFVLGSPIFVSSMSSLIKKGIESFASFGEKIVMEVVA